MKVAEAIPPELHPGIDYAAQVFDPDGHCIQLYHAMEQIGWDGKPRSKESEDRACLASGRKSWKRIPTRIWASHSWAHGDKRVN